MQVRVRRKQSVLTYTCEDVESGKCVTRRVRGRRLTESATLLLLANATHGTTDIHLEISVMTYSAFHWYIFIVIINVAYPTGTSGTTCIHVICCVCTCNTKIQTSTQHKEVLLCVAGTGSGYSKLHFEMKITFLCDI